MSIQTVKPRNWRLNTLDSTSRGLVHLWGMNEAAGLFLLDSSPNTAKLPFSATASERPTWVASDIGFVLNFDGVSEFISVPDNTISAPGDRDFAWEFVWRTTATSSSSVLGQNTAQLNWMGISGEKTAFSIDGAFLQEDYPPSTNDGLWHHVVGQRRLSATELYVDGVLKKTGAAGSSLTAEDGFRIGDLTVAGYEWEGGIAKVAIYNRGLSPYEIRRLSIDPWATVRPQRNYIYGGVTAGGAPPPIFTQRAIFY